jgi:hypothetical protein
MVPLDLPHGFVVNDVQGEAAIPIDVLALEDTPPPPPEVPVPAPASAKDEKDNGVTPAIQHRDASAPLDSGTRDATEGDVERDASADAAADAVPDSGAAVEGGEIALAGDAGDAGSIGPRDPEAIVGAVGAIQADVIYVILVVNAEVIRNHPVGARMGYLLRGIPQWDEFISGTDIDPVRDTDWVMISGPSLVNTSRDVVLVHYSASDAVVDHAVDVVSRKSHGGARFDAGVPGVRASLAHADRAERVILRAQSHVLAIVPPMIAEKVARKLASARMSAHIRPGEAVYLRLVDPHHPMPEIPDSISELRMRVIPSADGAAEVFVDCDTKDPDAAVQAADSIKRMIRRHNDGLTSLLTHGLLDHVGVTNVDSVVKVHVVVTRDQIETLMTLVGSFLGVEPDSPVPPASPSPRLPPSLKPSQSR